MANYYNYVTLKSQCNPQTIAQTSNTMFINPEVKPYWVEKINNERRGSEPRKVAPPTQPKSLRAQWPSNPTTWGPHLWYYLHTAAANYPANPSQEQKDGMKELLCNLKWSIPCQNCSKHFGDYIEKNRTNLDTICSKRDDLFNFLHEIHNKVNARTGKPILTREEAWAIYQK